MSRTRASLPTRAALTLALATAAALPAITAGCQLEVAYDGAFACSEPPYTCPDGYTCQAGECVDPSGQPPPVGTPDGAPPTPGVDGGPDGSSPPPPPPPDAGTPDAPPTTEETFATSFGENSNALVKGVTIDAELNEDNPTLNQGGQPRIGIDAAPRATGLLQFDLSSLPTTTKVVSAELTIEVSDPIETGEYEIYAVTEAWNEGQVTWNNRSNGNSWKSVGVGTESRAATPMAICAPRDLGSFTFALDAATVEGWIANPASNHGMAWFSTSPDGRGGNFRSSEFDTANERPILQLVLTP